MKEYQNREDAMEAEDWKTMYMLLLHAISDVVEKHPKLSKEEIIGLLTEASLRAEDYYIRVGSGGLELPEQEGF